MKEPEHDKILVTLKFPYSDVHYVYIGVRVKPGWWAWSGTRRRKIDGDWSRMSNFIGNNKATIVSTERLVSTTEGTS